MIILCTIPVLASNKVEKASIKSVTSTDIGSGTVTINKVSGAKGYQVDFALNSKFTSGRKTYTTSSTTFTKSGLSRGKKYYVRVRAYKTSGNSKQYGSWSSVKSFTTKNYTKPGTPAISNINSPDAGKASVSFNSVSNATKYEIQFATDSKFSNGLKTSTTSGTSVSRTDLSKGKKYYVRVRAINHDVNGSWSSVKTFTVESKNRIKLTQEQWLNVVKEWCDYMIKDGDWIYSNSNNRKNIDTAIKESHTTNCALMISHALQRAGILTKGNTFWSNEKGEPQGSAAWKEICKYAEVIKVNKKTATKLSLQPGDIVMWDSHMNVYIGKDGNGNLTWYDGSSLLTVEQKHGSIFKNFYRVSNDIPVPKTGKPHVAYKIIRLNYKK